MSVTPWPAIGDRGTVVTSTHRLARWVRDRYDREQLAAGRKAWLPLDVLAWDAWVQRCWRNLREADDLVAPAVALSDEQEWLVWEDAVRATSGSLGALMMPAEIAREAQRAWRLAADYRIGAGELERMAGAETRRYLVIARRVEERLRDSGWCLRSQCQASVAEARSLDALAPGGLVLAGFDDLTPAQQRLVGALRSSGVEVCRLATPEHPAGGRVLRCADPASEIEQAAIFARMRLEAGPGTRVGIVVPDLEQRRQEIEEIFDDVLTPGRLMPGSLSPARPWGLSLGRALSDWPVADTALRMLGLLFGDAPFTDFSLLLRSPFIGSHAELSDRGCVDGRLRERGMYRTGVSGLVFRLSTALDRGPACADLVDRLGRFAEFSLKLPRHATPDRWAVAFAEALGIAGWPGDRPLDSAEFQCREKWYEVLSVLASAGAVTGAVTGAAALDQLRRIATDTTFQPESGDPPIQVLGLLETPGLSFDALWVTGMHHLAWPRPVRPNPLIPASVQRSHGMPRACAAVELEFARARTLALRTAADEVMFSWPAQAEDEELRPSPLLAGMEEAAEAGSPWRGIAARDLGSAAVEKVADYRLRSLPPGARARGGSAVLRWQSACPFQAQARSRLDARSLEQPGPGVSAMDSGRVSHLALQWLWEDWGGNGTPAAIGDDQLAMFVAGAVGRACRRLLPVEGALGEALIALEQGRATTHILALLEEDLAREPFTVDGTELESTAGFGGLEFLLRIDRIDRLADGRLLLIDYKTGRVKASDWHGDRPREPQLPLYAVTAPQGMVSGIAFGCLRAGEEGYSGYAESDLAGTAVQGVESMKRPPDEAGSWNALMAAWKRRLMELAGRFADGEATVDPRSVHQDCRYCDLSSLCRRHELALSPGGDDE